MSALPRADVTGPARTLNDALHDLHHRAGWPSLRTLARETGVSHTTVSKVFSSPALPAWGTLELLVEAMDGDPASFHDLWLAASSPTNGTAPARPRIAGRRAELEAVRRHLEGGAGLRLVTGEAGMGKTTLVDAAVATADSTVGVGRCVPLAAEVSLLPIADCLRRLLESDPAWFLRAIGSCHPYVGAAVGTLVPEAATEPSTPDLDRQLLFSAIRTLLLALADDRPVALLVEDLHWADPGTLDVLEHLLTDLPPVPVLATWRTDDLATPASSEAWLRRVRRLRDAEEIVLSPLSLPETAEQLHLMAPEADHDVVRIHERSGGLPLFTEQLAAHASDGPGLPRVLADLLDQRLDGLAPGGWSVLLALGIASRALPRAVLENAAAIDPDTLTRELRDLSSRHLLRSSGAGFELHHPLLAEAVRRRAVVGEDAGAHRSLAAALARHQDSEPAEVAEHWHAAGEIDKEIEWRMRAARSARARFDRAQEAEQWLKVLAVWPDGTDELGEPPSSRPQVYLAAMDALRASGQFDRAAAMSDAAGAALGDVDDLVRAELLVQAAEFRGMREGPVVAAELIEEALRLYERHPPTRGSLIALDRRMMVLRDQGRYAESREVLDRAIASARELGEAEMLRDLLMQRAWALGCDGDTHACAALLTAASAGSGSASDPLGDLRQAVYLTDVLLINATPPRQVLAVGRPALVRARDAGIDNLQTTFLRGNLAVAARRGGFTDVAEEVLGVPREAPVVLGQWWLHVVRAELDVALGRLDASRTRLATIDEGLGGHRDWDLDALLVAAEVECWSRQSTDILEVLRGRLAVLSTETPIRVVARALAVCARLAADASSPEDGALVRGLGTRAGLAGSEHHDDPALEAWRSVFEGELARLAGRLAPDRWAGAAAVWDELEHPHDAAYCRWRAAQCALREGRGTVAARLLKRAAADARTHLLLSRAIAGTAAR